MHRTGCSHLYVICRSSPRCRTTDVESTHGQLGTGFTDRLCRDNTDRLTHVSQMTARQITTIALTTDTEACITGNRRAYMHFVDTHGLQTLNHLLIQHG